MSKCCDEDCQKKIAQNLNYIPIRDISCWPIENNHMLHSTEVMIQDIKRTDIFLSDHILPSYLLDAKYISFYDSKWVKNENVHDPNEDKSIHDIITNASECTDDVLETCGTVYMNNNNAFCVNLNLQTICKIADNKCLSDLGQCNSTCPQDWFIGDGRGGFFFIIHYGV